MKEQVGKAVAARVNDGDIIGVGTGSTVDAALKAIGERVEREDIRLRVIPSSYQSAWLCQQYGLRVYSPLYDSELSWGFDGADEVDPQLRMIKGRGGAMLQEKILAAKCKKFLIIVDESKLVTRLGEKYPIPIEVVPEALNIARLGLLELGAASVELRQAVSKHGPVITEAGNLILDAQFSAIPDDLEFRIKSLLGVVESGLFLHYTDEVLIAKSDGVYVRTADSKGNITEQTL